MTMSRTATAALILVLATCGGASAQSTETPKTNLDAQPGTLSDKLSQTGGVIKPTGNVDPEMHKSAPQTGSMPVVKPGQVPPQSGTGPNGKGGLY